MSNEIDTITEHLIYLWENNQKQKANKISLATFSDRKIKKDKFFYLKCGHYFRKQEDHKAAFKFFKKSSVLFPDDELSSVCSYIELVKLHKYKYAIKELDRYLTTHSANIYITTLEELFSDIKRGVATDYKDIIIKHCKINKIKEIEIIE